MERREFLAALGIAAVLAPGSTRAAIQSPLPAKGVKLSYDVLYGDSEIGRHDILIREHDKADHIVIEHSMSAEVRILFAVAYSLNHRSTEVWEGSELRALESETVENDEQFSTRAQPTDGGMIIRSDRHETRVPHGAVSSDSFWLASALAAPVIVNVRSGETARPVVRPLGGGKVALSATFPHGGIEAELAFDGEFLRQATIDSDGHEVVLRRMDAT